MPTPEQSRRADRPSPATRPPGDRGNSSRTVVYTDGACSGNPGPGGWAWVIPDGRFRSGAARHTTNQRMELAAALDAVNSITGPLEIVSDSKYVVNCFRNGWWKGWIRRGWVNAKKQPVANRDLWEPLVEAYQARQIRFRWVKGHAGNEWNDRADRLAVEASLAQRGVDPDGNATGKEDSTDPNNRDHRPIDRPSGTPLGDAPSDGTTAYIAGHGAGRSGPGGWAWMVPRVRYRSGFEPYTTNPRMVLTAARDCLLTVDGRIELVSDSDYLVNCFVNRWWERWLQKGWRNAQGKKVANRDLWKPIIEVFQSGRVTARRVDAHDEKWFETTNWLASETARTSQGAEGEAPQAGIR